MLANPKHRAFPIPAARLAVEFGCTPEAIINLARRPHTGVRRFQGGYDYWEVARWVLMREQRREEQATRRANRAS